MPIQDKSEQDISKAVLLSLPDVASYLRVSLTTARKLVDDGQLPFHRLGKAVRVARIDLEELLARTKEVTR